MKKKPGFSLSRPAWPAGIKENGMCNVILCTHSTLAEGFRRAALMILRSAEALAVLNFEDGCSPDTLLRQLDTLAETFRKRNESYCVVTDLFGASPFNAAMQLCAKDHAVVFSGVNLGLLLELLQLPQAEASSSRLHTLIVPAQDQLRCYDPARLLNSPHEEAESSPA